MELVENIKEILNLIGLKAPVFDIHYDSTYNVVGYVSDPTFENIGFEDRQKKIWLALKERLGAEDFHRILYIYSETAVERASRLTSGSATRNNSDSNFFRHLTTNLTIYWLFIDISKVQDGYKAIYLALNQKEDFFRGATFVYPAEINEFMELEDREIYDELFSNTYSKGELEIKSHIIEKYDRLAEKGVYGRDNIYKYVFDSFTIEAYNKRYITFTKDEVDYISNAIDNFDSFSIKGDLDEIIARSKIVNQSSVDVSRR